MIFSDFTTASQFRERAHEERRTAVIKLVRSVIAHPEVHDRLVSDNTPDWLIDGLLHDYMRDTPLTNVLLNRSGMVFPANEGETVHDAILTHDNHTEDYDLIAALRRVGMTGGLDMTNGRIHT
jgi:hypothetical protein